MSYHLTAFELTNQVLHTNFPSIKRKFFQKNLKSTLPSSVALSFRNLGITRRQHFLKATSYSTIFDIPMRPLREHQRHRRRFTR